MKLSRTFHRGSGRLGVMVSFAALLCGPSPALADPILGSADPYAVLGQSEVTISGQGATITGNVGSPTSVTGGAGITFPTAGFVDNPDAASALGAANGAATFLSGFGSPIDMTGTNLGGLVLDGGEYSFTSSVTYLDGTLTLDAQNNDNAIFIFDISAALEAGLTSTAVVNVINGGPGVGVYWLVGSEATLNPDTTFEGNIIAGTEVVLDDSAQILCGRAIADTAVTMSGGSPTNLVSNNDISSGCTGGLEGGFTSSVTESGTTYSRVNGTVAPASIPEPSTLAIFASGLLAVAWRLRPKVILADRASQRETESAAAIG
jgi:hypothetical protein